MCCGVIPILFGWFLRVLSLHVLLFTFFVFFSCCFFLFVCLFLLEIVRGKGGVKEGEGKMHGL